MNGWHFGLRNRVEGGINFEVLWGEKVEERIEGVKRYMWEDAAEKKKKEPLYTTNGLLGDVGGHLRGKSVKKP